MRRGVQHFHEGRSGQGKAEFIRFQVWTAGGIGSAHNGALLSSPGIVKRPAQNIGAARTERKGHSLMIIQSKTGELAQPAQKFSAREKNDAQRLFLIRKQIQRFDDTVVGGGRPGIKFLEKAPHGTWSRHIAFALTTGESRGNEAGDGIGRFRKTCVYRSAPASRLLPGYPAGFTPHTGQADIFHQTVVRPCAVRTMPFRFLSRKEQPQRRFFTAQRAQHPVKLLSVEHGDLLNIFASFFLRFQHIPTEPASQAVL